MTKAELLADVQRALAQLHQNSAVSDDELRAIEDDNGIVVVTKKSDGAYVAHMQRDTWDLVAVMLDHAAARS